MVKLCLRWFALLCGLFSVPLLAHHGTSNYSTTAQTLTLSGSHGIRMVESRCVCLI